MEVVIQIVLNSLYLGSLYAILGVAFNLGYGPTRFVNMSHGLTAAVGGYIVFTLTREGLGFWWSVVLALLLSAFFSWLVDYFLQRPLRQARATTLVPFVTSLGVMIVGQGVLAIIFSSQFWTLPNLPFWVGVRHDFFGAILTGTQLLTMGFAPIVIFSVFLLLKYSRFGKALRAVSDDPEVAKMVGVDTDVVFGWTHVLIGILAGSAGVLAAMDTGVYPTMTLLLILIAVIVGVVGGLGSVSGALLAGYLFSFIENFGVWQLGSGWRPAIATGLLLVFLLFRPTGIMGEKK